LIQCLLQITSLANAGVGYGFSRPEFLTNGARRELPSRWKPVLCLSLLLPLVSCANEDGDFRKEMQQILSWSASAELILDARLGARVPQGFTDLAVERCRKQISDLSSELPQTSGYDRAKAAVAKLNGLIAAAHEEISDGRLEEGRRHLADLHRYEVEQRRVFGAEG
jgi:hypothetical protein